MKVLFCVGFCGGLFYEKVKLGDVVILVKLMIYVYKKVMNDWDYYWGIIIFVSFDFVDFIKYVFVGWKVFLVNLEVNRKIDVYSDVEFLSGFEFVNFEWWCEEFLERYSEVIVIEMEGEGRDFFLYF